MRRGDHLVICDQSGFKVWRSECVKQWDGQVVLKRFAESRHPQDFLRAGRRSRPVKDARPESVDVFVSSTDNVSEGDTDGLRFGDQNHPSGGLRFGDQDYEPL